MKGWLCGHRHDAQRHGHAAWHDANGEWDANAARHGHGDTRHDGHAHAAAWMMPAALK